MKSLRGLPSKLLTNFAQDFNLQAAQQMARTQNDSIRSIFAKSNKYFEQDKSDGILNFYPEYSKAPFTPIGAKGPWLVTEDQKIIYEVGGYGMLGFGHNPSELQEVLSLPQVMANVMTPSIAQSLVIQALQDEIGQNRKEGCPFEKFGFLNSGSEANCLAFRYADAQAKKHSNGRKLVLVNLVRSFHGRTYMSTQVTYSCQSTYKEKLATYDQFFKTYSILPNDLEDAKRVFKEIKENNEYPMATIFEPIMGEGWVGKQIEPEFYQYLRDITNEFKSVLIADSVQAGFRGNGYLSIVDYPGFETLEAPDMETWSKAIFSGQFPVSCLALKNSDLFTYGLYGNTMTCNPRGLMICAKVLETFRTSEFDIRKNIREQGKYLLDAFKQLQQEFPEMVDIVSGTGLLAAMFMNEKYNVEKRIERQCRLLGLNVIKGSNNALRMTPWFKINKEEIDLVKSILRESLQSIKDQDAQLQK